MGLIEETAMDKKTTQMVKGLAILIMIMHHFCATTLFPNISSGMLQFGATFKICVAIYAVLSGYGYYFAKDKSVKYGLKKIWGLLQIYWLSLFTIFIPISIGGGGSVPRQRCLSNYLDCSLI
jgi:FtsH-binding integral membrane protein